MKDEILKEIKPSKVLALTLYLVPLWWVLGLLPVIFHMAAFLYFFSVMKKEGSGLPLPSLFLILFLSIYAFSFLLHWAEFPLERALASLYNLSIWVMGLLLILGIYRDRDLELKEFLRSGAFLFWFTLALSLLDIYLYRRARWLSFPTLLGTFFNPPQLHSSLVGQFFQAKMHIIGRWPLDFLPRVAFYSPYPNAFAGLVFLLWGATLTLYQNERKIWLQQAVNLAALFLLLLSMSRASFLLGLGNFIAAELLILPPAGGAILLSLVFLLLFFSVLGIINPVAIFTRIARGSTESRLLDYGEALRFFKESPLFGIGIKPRFLQGVPLGSHSTYIGVLLKTGLLGFFTFLAYAFSQIRAFFKERNLPFLALSLLCMLGWMGFEDIDAPSLTAFLFFVISGLLIRYNLKGGFHEGN